MSHDQTNQSATNPTLCSWMTDCFGPRQKISSTEAVEPEHPPVDQIPETQPNTIIIDEAPKSNQGNVILKQKVENTETSEPGPSTSKRKAADVQLLLLGTGGSGKSTFIRNLQFNFGEWDESYSVSKDAFTQETRLTFRVVIINNILKNTRILILKMAEYGFEFGQLSNETVAQEVKSFIGPEIMSIDRHYEFNPRIAQLIKNLWKDRGIQEAYRKRREFVSPYLMTDSFAYFMKRIDDVGKEDYCPSVDDILHCRLPTQGRRDYRFVIDKISFAMCDLGGDQSARATSVKHIMDFLQNVVGKSTSGSLSGGTGIKSRKQGGGAFVIFMASLSDYNQVHPEYRDKTLLDESLDYFRVLVSSAPFKHVGFIVFLNKQDIFHEKLATYRDYHRLGDDKPNESDAPTHENFEWAEKKVIRRFEHVFRQARSQDVGFVRITCATDTTVMPVIFGAAKIHIMNRCLMDAFFNA